jgi:hypothetical protein
VNKKWTGRPYLEIAFGTEKNKPSTLIRSIFLMNTNYKFCNKSKIIFLIIPTDFRASHESFVTKVIAYGLNNWGLVPAGAREFPFITQSKRHLRPIPNFLLPNDYWGIFFSVKPVM